MPVEIERIAKGLFAANLIAAAETAGITPPAVIRIDATWARCEESRKRWVRVAAEILSSAPGIDLGAMTGNEPLPRLSNPPCLDETAFYVFILLAFALGFVCCELL